MSGSSPRSRGTRVQKGSFSDSDRFIPALAGNTGISHRLHQGWPVHPRARREHSAALRAVTAAVGSSPRSRGTHREFLPAALRCRFIPALAGNTSPAERPPPPGPVHPRARGEHDTSTANPRRYAGSSPRSRGTPMVTSPVWPFTRFIPALAGNTWSDPGLSSRSPVHPRARGEHRFRGEAVILNAGSSPRSRGTPRVRGAPRPLFRFIPALAGNTGSRRRSRPAPPVHPRARGEHGTPYLSSDPEDRFIPALAGNTI